MKRLISITVLGLAMVGSAFAQTDVATAARAAATVTKIQSGMLDPESFRLDGVYTSKYKTVIKGQGFHRQEVEILCFAYRSHNHMGGYSEGRAYLMANKLELFSGPPEDNGTFLGYDNNGWGDAPCKAKKLTDITAEVKAALNPPAPVAPPSSPEDAAKKAQQYANCLKAAVDNPSIVCKQ